MALFKESAFFVVKTVYFMYFSIFFFNYFVRAEKRVSVFVRILKKFWIVHNGCNFSGIGKWKNTGKKIILREE